jgi:hypothetical protein
MADEETVRNDQVRTDMRPDNRPDNRNDSDGDGQPDNSDMSGRNRLTGATSLVEAIRLSKSLENLNPKEKETAGVLAEVDSKINEMRMQGVSDQEINQVLGTMPANADPLMAAQDALKKLDELKATEEQQAKDQQAKDREDAEKREAEARDTYREVVAVIDEAAYLLTPMEGVGRDIHDPGKRGVLGLVSKGLVSNMMTPDSSNPLNPGSTPGMFPMGGGRSLT